MLRKNLCTLLLLIGVVGLHFAAVEVGTAAAQDDGSLFFGGLRNTPVGQAKLDPGGSGLIVANIGSSGEDGVRVDTAGGEFLLATMGQMDPAALPTGAGLQLTAVGRLGNQEAQPLVKMQVEDVGNEMHLSVDFSALEVISPTVVIFDADGNVLDQVVARDDIIVRIPVPLDCIFDPFWPMWPEIWSLIDFPQPIPLAIGDREFVEGSRIAFIAQMPQTRAGVLSNVLITGRDMPSFTLLDEALGFFHTGHQALGEARFRAGNGALTVSNIGSSGEDGVAIDTDGKEALIVTLDQLTIPQGASASVAGFGTVDGKADQPIADTTVRSNGEAMQATFDFSPVGVDTYAVEVYRGNQLVDRIDQIRGVGAIIRRPEGCTFDPVWPMGPDIWSIIEFPELAEIMIPGRDPVRGDRIVAIAKDVPAQVGLLDEVTIRGQGFDSFTILDEYEPESRTWFRGLRQDAQRNSALAIEDDVLVVSAREADAPFGVDVDTAGSEFLLATMAQMDPETLPTGAGIQMTAIGRLGDQEGQPLVKMQVEDVGTEMHLSVDFSALEVVSPTIAIFDADGNVLDSVVADDDIIVRIPVPLDCIFDPFWPMWPDIWSLIDFPEPIPLAIGDREFVNGSRIAFIAHQPPVKVGQLAKVSITGQQMPSFTILDEAIGAFDMLPHRALGEARLSTVDDRLVVSNIGSSGEDGVQVDLGQAKSVGMKWQPLSEQVETSSGAFVDISSIGAFRGVTDSFLGSSRVTDIGSGLEVTADFSAINEPTQRIEVYDNGRLVTVLRDHTGPVANVADWPISGGKLGGQTKCIFWRWEDVITISLPGATQRNVVMGDEVRILVEDPADGQDYLSSFNLKSADMSDIVIETEDVVLPPDGTIYLPIIAK